MTYTTLIEIGRPREKAVQLVADPAQMPKWPKRAGECRQTWNSHSSRPSSRDQGIRCSLSCSLTCERGAWTGVDMEPTSS